MHALDGNAIAGWLFEHYGAEMTATRGRCRHCGTRSVIAELRVYSRAPGVVVRCPTCGNVVMVLVRIRRATSVFADSFELSDVGLLEQRQP